MKKEDIVDLYPLTPLQEGMLSHLIGHPQSRAHIIQTHYLIEGALNEVLFRKSWEFLVQQYDFSRRVFVSGKTPRPLQLVTKEGGGEFREEDISALSTEEQQKTIRQFKEEDLAFGFRLEKGPLFRYCLFTKGPEQFELIMTIHHIVMDAWSMSSLQDSLFIVYNALKEGKTPRLPQAVPFGKYVQWLESQDKEKAREYWKKVLENSNELTEEQQEIPYEEGPSNCSYEEFSLGKNRSSSLRSYAEQEGVTLSTLSKALWGILLGIYRARTESIFTAVTSLRPEGLLGSEKVIGPCIHLVPVRVQVRQEDMFSSVVQSVHEQYLLGQQYHFYSYQWLQKEGIIPASAGNVILNVESTPGAEGESSRWEYPQLGFVLEQVDIFCHHHEPLEIYLFPASELRLKFSYQPPYTLSLIHKMAEDFCTVVDLLSSSKSLTIREITALIARNFSYAA